MFGNRYFALSGLWDSWLCHLIGLHPILIYDAPSGLTLAQFYHSPEGAIYDNEAVTPLANKKKITTKSPEGAIYDNEARKQEITPLRAWIRGVPRKDFTALKGTPSPPQKSLPQNPEGAIAAVTPSNKKSYTKSEGAKKPKIR
ncbi:MAG: hypothetical protein IPN15_15420 [Saprospiraceae bacterium]|nr:hypothetical protein [Candidatus Vicinibacter affinis]